MTRQTIRLSGLAPERLLAVLALYGTMRALETARPEWAPTVAWEGPPWRPVLSAATPETLTEDLVAEAALAGIADWAPAFDFDGHADIKHTPEAFKAWAKDRTGNAAAVAAALASDAVTKRNNAAQVQPTPLCAIFGQGHQHFLSRLESNLDTGTADPTEIADALFRWRYEREGTKRRGQRIVKGSLRLDPQEDRRYALAAGDPSAEAVTTIPGANRLAPLGLTLMPVVPRNNRLAATATQRPRRGPVHILWPVWAGFLDVAALSDLLDLPGLIADPPDPAQLRPYGVQEVYRCTRRNVGKFMSFSPATAQFGLSG